MAQNTKEYHKLPGSKKGFLIGKYTLWLGTDHLLQIFSRVGVEEYRRFYFSDIQAIVTRKTAIGTLQNIFGGLLVLIFAVPAVIFDGGWSLFYAVVAGVMLLLLLMGLFKGPTCETKLMTAVQTEKLHTLHRLKNTSKVMDRLRKNILQVQGRLNQEALDKMPARSLQGTKADRRISAHGSKKAALRSEKGRAHMGLFALLLLDGILVGMGFFFTHVMLTIIGSITILGMGILVIVALVKQHHSTLGGALRAITWACLGFICINFVAGYIISIVFAMENPGVVYNQWEMFKSMSLLSPWESPLKMSFDIFTISGALILGIPGLFMLYRTTGPPKPQEPPRAVNSRQPAIHQNTGLG
jgi:hypothetical protein